MIQINNFLVVSAISHSSWPWYVIRAAGFTAAGLLILLMLSGIGQVTGITYKFIEPIKAWVVHKALAISLCVAIAIHGGFLLIDHYVHFSIIQLFVPFLNHYSNKTSIFSLSLGWAAIAFGILASYGVAIIVFSSLRWIDTKKKTWRKLHYISYAVFALVFFHALSAGTDLRYGLFRDIWMLLGIIVIVGIIMRIRRAGSIKSKTN